MGYVWICYYINWCRKFILIWQYLDVCLYALQVTCVHLLLKYSLQKSTEIQIIAKIWRSFGDLPIIFIGRDSPGTKTCIQHWKTIKAFDATSNRYLGSWSCWRWRKITGADFKSRLLLFRGVSLRRCSTSVHNFINLGATEMFQDTCGSFDWWYLEPSTEDAQTLRRDAACDSFSYRLWGKREKRNGFFVWFPRRFLKWKFSINHVLYACYTCRYESSPFVLKAFLSRWPRIQCYESLVKPRKNLR